MPLFLDSSSSYFCNDNPLGPRNAIMPIYSLPLTKVTFTGPMGLNRAGDMLPIDYEP